MGVEILVFAIVVILICALIIYAFQNLPLGLPPPFLGIIIVLVVLIAVVVIANRAGVF